MIASPSNFIMTSMLTSDVSTFTVHYIANPFGIKLMLNSWALTDSQPYSETMDIDSGQWDILAR
jgi:hypothetical protein